MKRGALIFFLLIFSLCTVKAERPVRTIPAHSKVYVSPSSASRRLSRMIEHPGVLDHKLRHAGLVVVELPDTADYTISCDTLKGGGPHSKAVAATGMFGAAWLTMDVQFAVRDTRTSKMLFSITKNERGGGDMSGTKADLQAIFCRTELTKLIQ